MENTLHSNIPQDLIEKIQKLINLEEGAKAIGNQAEAEAAAGRIQTLLTKHQLNLFEVQSEHLRRRIEVKEERFDLNAHQSKTDSDWVMQLFQTIAKHNMCQVVHILRNRKKYDQGEASVIGSPQNVQLVYYVVEQLIAKILIAKKLAWKEYDGFEKANTFKRGFYRGCVKGIKLKLDEAKQAVEQEIKASGEIHAKNFELMVIANHDASVAKMQEIFPNLRKSASASLSSTAGYMKGISAGRNMDINKGVKNTPTKGYLN